MRLFRSSLTLVLSFALAGCAFNDGDPWGRAEFDVEASFDPPASRLEDGKLKTAKDYRVTIDELEVTFDVVELEVRSDGEAVEFDPANPPPGYSLCHNGHCHADSGELVPYEEIAVEQAAGDFVVMQALDAEHVALDGSPVPLKTDVCSSDCELQPGELGVVRLSLHSVRVVGEVSRVGDDGDPDEIDLEFDVDAEIEATVEGTIGRGELGGVAIAASFELPPSFLDPVEFAGGFDDPDGPAVSNEQIRRTIEDSAEFDVTVDRYDL